MKIRTLALCIGLCIAAPAFAQEEPQETDAATIEAIRAAAAQMASAAQSVRVALETNSPATSQASTPPSK